MSAVIEAKRKACVMAIDHWMKDGYVVGIGSGTTIQYAVEYLAQLVRRNQWRIQCIPTSFQARELLIRQNLLMTSLDINETIDVAFDGADEVNDQLVLIKGGGGCLLQEKIVASNASKFIVLVDQTKCSNKLGTNWTKGIPIEVIPMAYKPIQSRIEKLFGGTAVLRQAVAKMGPLVTDNGNFIIDWKFDSNRSYNWAEVDAELLQISGLVETGLFINMASKVYVGNLDGSVTTMDPK